MVLKTGTYILFCPPNERLCRSFIFTFTFWCSWLCFVYLCDNIHRIKCNPCTFRVIFCFQSAPATFCSRSLLHTDGIKFPFNPQGMNRRLLNKLHIRSLSFLISIFLPSNMFCFCILHCLSLLFSSFFGFPPSTYCTFLLDFVSRPLSFGLLFLWSQW